MKHKRSTSRIVEASVINLCDAYFFIARIGESHLKSVFSFRDSSRLCSVTLLAQKVASQFLLISRPFPAYSRVWILPYIPLELLRKIDEYSVTDPKGVLLVTRGDATVLSYLTLSHCTNYGAFLTSP